MFARIRNHILARRSLQALLSRADDRLLDDIGLGRAEAELMLAGALPLYLADPADAPVRADARKAAC